jgi:hypothetical protein
MRTNCMQLSVIVTGKAMHRLKASSITYVEPPKMAGYFLAKQKTGGHAWA